VRSAQRAKVAFERRRAVMRLLYCDETNMQERAGDFFVYAGLVVDGDRAQALSQRVDRIRREARIDRAFRLKFNPKPDNLTHPEFNAVEQAVMETAIEYGCLLLASVILHDIATNPDDARRNEINRVCYHFDCLLGRYPDAGLVLIDRFSDRQIDAHLSEKFSVGLTGLPYAAELRLERIVGFHYAAIGQSHFSSIIDIALGSLRFAINAHTRNEEANLETAQMLLRVIQPLFHREPLGGDVHEISFFFSPKVVRVPHYRQRYESLKQFMAEQGINTAQAIVAERNY
jgi:hypothetical protein